AVDPLQDLWGELGVAPRLPVAAGQTAHQARAGGVLADRRADGLQCLVERARQGVIRDDSAPVHPTLGRDRWEAMPLDHDAAPNRLIESAEADKGNGGIGREFGQWARIVMLRCP